MNGDPADLTHHQSALAFVWALNALLVPAPFSPFRDLDELWVAVDDLADTHVGNADALFHLWLLWDREGRVLAEPLDRVLTVLLLRHPAEGEAALAAVLRRVGPVEARRLREQFGDD